MCVCAREREGVFEVEGQIERESMRERVRKNSVCVIVTKEIEHRERAAEKVRRGGRDGEGRETR